MGLTQAPVLASWERRGHRDQARLETFLSAAVADTRTSLDRLGGDVAVELAIGLAPEQSLTKHRDLDNYLLPLVARLGHQRIKAAFAVKHHALRSTLAVGPAVFEASGPPSALEVRPVGSYERPAWKEQVRSRTESVLDGHAPHSGTAAVDVSFTTSSRRNWTSLWKPTIDAIAGPLLGVPDPRKPWSPNDDHITRLGLHHVVDDSLRDDVVIRAWWTLDHG